MQKKNVHYKNSNNIYFEINKKTIHTFIGV